MGAILCGDPSSVKFVLSLPGVDIAVKKFSILNGTSSATDILCRNQELCPNICGTETTSSATASHFSCMYRDWEILNLQVLCDTQGDSKGLSLEYFYFE